MKNGQANNKQVFGNTLDYYNDDMSRRAVGKLFNNIDDLSADGELSSVNEDTSSIVVGYDDKPESAAEPEYARAPERRDPERRRGELEYKELEYARESEHVHDPAMVRALERAAEMAAPRAPEPERVRGRVFAEESYDMSMYRRNKNVLEDDEYEEILTPRKRMRTPEPAAIRRAEPLPDEMPMPPRRRTRKIEPDDYAEKAQVQRERDEVLRAANAHRRTQVMRPYIAGIFVVLMIALAILLFQVNRLNGRLEEAEAQQEELNRSLEDYSRVQLQSKAQEEEIALLKSQLEDALAQAAPESAEVGAAAQTPGTTQATETTLPATYVVASGDNLSKISNKFYGTPNQYLKIMEANGLTTDVVRQGQTLTIPK